MSEYHSKPSDVIPSLADVGDNSNVDEEPVDKQRLPETDEKARYYDDHVQTKLRPGAVSVAPLSSQSKGDYPHASITSPRLYNTSPGAYSMNSSPGVYLCEKTLSGVETQKGNKEHREAQGSAAKFAEGFPRDQGASPRIHSGSPGAYSVNSSPGVYLRSKTSNVVDNQKETEEQLEHQVISEKAAKGLLKEDETSPRIYGDGPGAYSSPGVYLHAKTMSTIDTQKGTKEHLEKQISSKSNEMDETSASLKRMAVGPKADLLTTTFEEETVLSSYRKNEDGLISVTANIRPDVLIPNQTGPQSGMPRVPHPLPQGSAMTPPTTLRAGQRLGQEPPRPGAVRIAGINADTASAQRSDFFALEDLPEDIEGQAPDDTAGLVEAHLVEEPKLLQGEEMNVTRIRRIAISVCVAIVVIGLAVGIGVGFAVAQDKVAQVIIVNITGSDLQKKDFTGHSETPTRCFETTEELRAVVVDYVRLRTKLEDSSPVDYLSIRNESVMARDEISVYGWPIGEFCVSKLTSLKAIFRPSPGAEFLTRFNEDISKWDVSNVQNLDALFQESARFNQSLSGWNTSQVTSMVWTFLGSKAFNQNLSSWDTSRVTSMSSMFHTASAFNWPIGTWDTTNVVEMNNAFYNAESFNQDLSEWNVTGVATVLNMFQYAESFNQDLSQWRLERTTELTRVFHGATAFNQPSTCMWGASLFGNSETDSLQVLLDAFTNTSCAYTSDPVIGTWPDTKMCGDCMSFFNLRLNVGPKEKRIRGYKAVNSPETLKQAVDEYMTYRMYGKRNRTRSLDSSIELAEEYGWPIGEWNVSLITNFSDVFSIYRSPLMGVFGEDISRWDVSNGASFARMFAGARMFNQALSGWDVSRATDMSGMFGGEVIEFGRDITLELGASSFNQNISSWNVSRVTRMDWMFQGAMSFNYDIGRWKTSRVETMAGMFSATQVFQYDLPWDVSNVRSFRSAFSKSTFNGQIRTWNTSSCVNFKSMFDSSPHFNDDIAGWDVTGGTTMESMFMESGFNRDISRWQPQRCISFEFMFTGARSWNQSLCEWGQYMDRPGVLTTSMFGGTKCLDPTEPQFVGSHVTPLCMKCTN